MSYYEDDGPIVVTPPQQIEVETENGTTLVSGSHGTAAPVVGNAPKTSREYTYTREDIKQFAREEVNESIDEVVEANPTLAGTEAPLEGLKVGDTKYVIPQGGASHCYIISGTTVYFLYYTDADVTNITELKQDIAAKGFTSGNKSIPANNPQKNADNTEIRLYYGYFVENNNFRRRAMVINKTVTNNTLQVSYVSEYAVADTLTLTKVY